MRYAAGGAYKMNRGKEVKLTTPELMLASLVGSMRQATNIRDNRQPKYGSPIDGQWQMHIEGALGEMAVAKLLNIYWNGSLGDFSVSDVGDYEVRTTSNHNHRLIVHPDDNDQAKFILVTGLNGTYRIRGWKLGMDCKKDEWWEDPGTGRPAYFVPTWTLRDIMELVK